MILACQRNMLPEPQPSEKTFIYFNGMGGGNFCFSPEPLFIFRPKHALRIGFFIASIINQPIMQDLFSS